MNDEESIVLAVKRRRLTLNDGKTVQYALKNRTYKRKKRILHLPDELLYYIFSKLPLIDIASIVAIVCKRFELVSINLLNITFCNIHNKIERLRANTIEKVTKAQTQENIILTYKKLNILDILHDQYKLIKASTWRYAYFQLAPRESYLAIRAGMLLDQFEIVFKHLFSKDVLLNFMAEIPNTILVLKDLSKEYLDKFEKYICATSQNTPNKSGCKIIDLLDCFNGIDRKVLMEHCEDNICNLNIMYTLDRAWFTVLVLNDTCGQHGEIYEDIRFMCKRLRRLVRAHNSVYFEETLTYRSHPSPFLIDSIHPNFEMYCGYGEMCHKFYFYGTMTEGYMAQRLGRGINMRDDNDDDNLNENPFFIDIDRENDILEPPVHVTRPQLTFEVNVKCPLHLAPWFVLKKYNTSGDLNMLTAVKTIQSSMSINKTKSIVSIQSASSNKTTKSIVSIQSASSMTKVDFDMTLVITSNTAKENRLPYKYKYCIIQTPEFGTTITGNDIGI